LLLEGLLCKFISKLVAQGDPVLGGVFAQVPESLMGFDLVGGDEVPPSVVDCPSEDPTVDGLVAEVGLVGDLTSQEAPSKIHKSLGGAQGLLG
jgi:hypothetical protein